MVDTDLGDGRAGCTCACHRAIVIDTAKEMGVDDADYSYPEVDSLFADTSSSCPGNGPSVAAICHTGKRFASTVHMVDTDPDDKAVCNRGRTWVAITCHRFHHKSEAPGKVAAAG